MILPVRYDLVFILTLLNPHMGMGDVMVILFGQCVHQTKVVVAVDGKNSAIFFKRHTACKL